MKWRRLGFGVAKEIFGGDFALVEVGEDNLSAGELKALLEETYPRLKRLSSFLLAINNEYASADLMVTGMDEIAVIPPVSGG